MTRNYTTSQNPLKNALEHHKPHILHNALLSRNGNPQSRNITLPQTPTQRTRQRSNQRSTRKRHSLAPGRNSHAILSSLQPGERTRKAVQRLIGMIIASLSSFILHQSAHLSNPTDTHINVRSILTVLLDKLIRQIDRRHLIPIRLPNQLPP
jgi:hypothetical protein